jgi:C4-dicarboxylate transporter DctM subunit
VSAAAAGLVGFLVMVALMLLGLPIAAVMMGVGLLGGMIAFGDAFFVSTASIAWGTLSENGLTAIPLFVLLGELLLRSGMADGMYRAFAAWFGRLPGGLLHTNIGCCALFAATSGSSVATAATIGTVALPSLRRHGYPMPDALGSLAAGGTLGILIPPSVNMIIYGSMTNTSVGKLFIAGIVPGLLLTGSFMLYIWIKATVRRDPIRHGVVPLGERIAALREVVLPLVIFGMVMGTLYLGIATATESAAIGVVAALVLIAGSRKLSLELLTNCFLSSARTTGMILLIVLAAFVLNLPLSFPVATSLGVDPIWFGIFIVIMCELGLITPPVGMNLFVVQGIRPDRGGLEDVIRGALPYAVIMIAFTLLLIAFPQIVLWLPEKM